MASRDAASTSGKDADTQESKERKSFQPFKKVKNFFKRKKPQDGKHIAKKSRSTSELDQPPANEPYPPSNSAPLNTTLSQSHDSVFSPTQDKDARPSGSTDGLAQSALLKDELSKRVKSRQSSGDSEDEGLPHSPYNVSSTSDVHPIGAHAKSSFSKASSSDNSLLSIGSLEVDEMEVSVREEAAIDFDMDPTHLTNLSNTAARHKIAIRPKQRRRRTFKPIPEDPLPPTPEVVEDSGNEEESALVSSSLMGSSMEQSIEVRESSGSTTTTEAKISNKKLKKQKKEEKKSGIKRKLSKKEQKLNKSDSSDKDEEAGFFSRMMRSFRRMSSRESKSVPNSPIHNVDAENVAKTAKHKSTSQLESVSWAGQSPIRSEPTEKSVSSRFLKKDEVRVEKQVSKAPKSSLIKSRTDEAAKQVHKNLDGKSSDVRRAQSAKSPPRKKPSPSVDAEPTDNLLTKSAKSQSLTRIAVDIQEQQPSSHFEKRHEEKSNGLQTVPKVIHVAGATKDYSTKPSAKTKLVEDLSRPNHEEKTAEPKTALDEDVDSQETESELAKGASKMTKMDSKRLDSLEKKDDVLKDTDSKMYGGVQLHKPINKQPPEVEPSSAKETTELSSVFARLSMKSDETENIVDTYILRTADKKHVIFDSSKESSDDHIKLGDENKCDTVCLDENKQNFEQLSESMLEGSKAEKLGFSPVALHQTESFLDEILTELSNTRGAEPLSPKEEVVISEPLSPEQPVPEQKTKDKPETAEAKVLIAETDQVFSALLSDAKPTKVAEKQRVSSKPPPARQAEKPRIISAKPQLVPKPNRVSSGSGKSITLADDDKITSTDAKRSFTQPIPKADVEEAQTSLASFAQTDQQQKRSYTQPVSDAEVAQAQVSMKSKQPLGHEKVEKKTSIPVTRFSNLRSRQTSLDESFSKTAQQSSSAKESVTKEASFDEGISGIGVPEKDVVITQLVKPSEIPRQTKLPSVSGSEKEKCQDVSKTFDEHSKSVDEHQPKSTKPSEIPRAIKQPVKTDESNVILKPKIKPPTQPSKLPRKQPVTSPTSESESTSDTPAWVLLAQKKHQKFKAVHEQKMAKSSCDSENIV